GIARAARGADGGRCGGRAARRADDRAGAPRAPVRTGIAGSVGCTAPYQRTTGSPGTLPLGGANTRRSPTAIRRSFMKVIGAGLPRTATLTQKVALEMLGQGPCYHMVNVLADLDLVPLWRAAYDGNADWDRIFDGFESTVDWPGGFFYRELMDRYPEAKVLLSVRDPEAWER